MSDVQPSSVWEMFQDGEFKNPTVISWGLDGAEVIAWANGKDELEIRVENSSGELISTEYATDENECLYLIQDAMSYSLEDELESEENMINEENMTNIDEVMDREDELALETYDYLQRIMPDMDNIGLSSKQESDLIYDILDMLGQVLIKHGVSMYRPCFIKDDENNITLVDFPYDDDSIETSDGYRFSRDFL